MTDPRELIAKVRTLLDGHAYKGLAVILANTTPELADALEKALDEADRMAKIASDAQIRLTERETQFA